MVNYVWLKNPHDREIEVEASKVDDLLTKGYKIIDSPTSQIPKIKLDAKIGYAHYPYGGYGRVEELLSKRIEWNNESTNIVYLGYPTVLERKEGYKYFLITAFEADKLPKGWVESCNTYDVIIVPSKWCKQLFLNAGVTVPVELMVQGTDDFTITEAPPESPFRFLHYNAFSDDKRKGWDLVTQAFLNVFGRYEKVELVLKGREHDNEADIKSVPRRPNIKILIKNMNRRDMANLQDGTHCFIFPSRGEGIGLPPIETMARGIPTILTDAYGLTESSYFGIKLTQFSYVDAIYKGFEWEGEPAKWVEPNLQQLEDKMFYVYRNYQRAKADALANAPIIKRYFNLDIQAETFIDIIEKHA
jgi:glycosyltransferase involved in cell wall biosynthesis